MQRWLQPVTNPTDGAEPQHAMSGGALTALTLTVVGAGILVAARNYVAQPVRRTASEWASGAVIAARQDLFGDSVNEAAFMRPGLRLSRAMVDVDRVGIDGVVEGVARLIGTASTGVRRMQTGFARSYALTVFFGAAALLLSVALVGST